MGRVFLSHSSADNVAARALRQWLVEQQPDLREEIFLDIDPEAGLPVGYRWKDALRRAGSRCEAVICLLSEKWQLSRECGVEYRTAEDAGKLIFVARLEKTATDITREWQRCDLFGDGAGTEIELDGSGETVVFRTAGLRQLLKGMRAAGIGTEYFPWPPPADPRRSPYRGWQPFEAVDAAVYFGRDTQILHAMDSLRTMRANRAKSILAVLGPSGSGKSSFLRAGVLPRLERDDRHFVVLDILRPERQALTGARGFAASLHGTRIRQGSSTATPGSTAATLGEIKAVLGEDDVDRIRELLDEIQSVAQERVLDRDVEAPGPTLVLPIDQAEELFGVDAGTEGTRLLELIARLIEGGAPMIVILTTRTDRYEAFQCAPELAGLDTVVFDELKPLPPTRFHEIIAGPARRATAAGNPLDLTTELVDRLLADCAGGGADTLPLLALTLERLYRDYRDNGTLTVDHYTAMGGIGSVVQSEIDAILSADPHRREHELDLLHQAFIPWLATINPGNDQPLRRIAHWDDLPAETHTLLDSFVDRRLLVKDRVGADTTVEVALESLLRQWEALASWLREQAEDLKTADRLELAAAEWESEEHNEAWLLSGARLADAEKLAATTGFENRLKRIRKYLNVSRQRETARAEAEARRQRAELEAAQEYASSLRTRSRVLALAMVIALVLAGTAGVFLKRARDAEARAVAETRLGVALRLAAEARSMLTEGFAANDIRAIQQALVASELAPDRPEAAAAVVGVGSARLNLTNVSNINAGEQILAISPDSTRLLISRSETPQGNATSVEVRDRRTGVRIGSALPLNTLEQVSSASFSADSGRVVLAQSRWDLEDTYVATVDIRIWDPVGGAPTVVRQEHVDSSETPGSLAMTPDGTRLTVLRQSSIQVLSTATGEPIHSFDDAGAHCIAISPDGTTLASTDLLGSIQLWNVHDGTRIGEPFGNESTSGGGGGNCDGAAVAFSHDGSRVVIGGQGGVIGIWDVRTLRQIGSPLYGHTDNVSGIAFSADDEHVISASRDGTIRTWLVDSGEPRQRTLPNSIVAIGASGRWLATATPDGIVRMWDTTINEPVGTPITMPTGRSDTQWRTCGAVVAPAGNSMITCAQESQEDGTVTGSILRLWNTDTGTLLDTRRVDKFLSEIALTNDGTVLIAFTPSGTDATVSALAPWKIGDSSVRVQLLSTSNFGKHAISSDGQLSVGFDGLALTLLDLPLQTSLGVALVGDVGLRSSGGMPLVALSPDGRLAATIGVDRALRLWDTRSGNKIGPTFRDLEEPRFVSFDITGNTMSVYSNNFESDTTTVRTWRIPTPSDLCAKLSSNMSHQQWKEWVSDSPEIPYVKQCPDLPIAEG
ncbi:TIR domain-containing protein [Nocardia sp. NPDC051832]|uniref:nSTAND1 domain-containing NTPase n=1 Tax=Nocardia sp. NPDC051832 TaxID=3155673 RepID=UPI003436D040